MTTLFRRALTSICLLGLMTACDTEEPGGGGEGGAGGEGGGQVDGGVDGGVGGEGGGEGGQGGVGGAGGVGGEGGGDPDGPCAELNEAQCNTRDDCAAQTDVFDDFSRCTDAEEAACRFLDEDQCGGRDDCAWDADEGVCGAPQLTCDDYGDARACEGANCFWYADGCQEEAPPVQCDQPDPGACEAAGCQWTDDGCIPQCGDFAEPACNARPECEWGPDGCAPAPEMMPCADLDPEQCVGREECTWFEDQCIDRPLGECGGLAEDACVQRPDCEPIYAGDGGGAVPDEPGEMPVPEPPPYEGCQERVFDCGGVPIEACDRTPGCQLIEEGDAIMCAAEDPAGCGQLDEQQCDRNPSCRGEFREICDGEGFPGDEDGDFAPDPLPVPCRVEFECVPDENGLPPCAQVDVDACFDRRDCQVVEDPDCEGIGALPPPDGEDPVQPPQCLRCVSADVQPGECFELEEFTCNDREDCRWNFEFGGPEPGDCACPPEEPDCGCAGDALIAPGGFCEPVPQEDCWDLEERVCFDRDGCRWVVDGGEPPPPEPCGCPPDEPDCACVEPGLPIAPPEGGFCEPDQPQGCWDFGDADNCQANGCEWRGGGNFCECFEGENGEEICDCFEGDGFCQEPEPQDFCAQFEQDECADIPECQWLEGMIEPCECPPDVPCECPEPAPGICRQIAPRDCNDLQPEECRDAPGCRVEEIFPPCAEPCGMDDPDCEPVICEPIEVCVPDEEPGRCQVMDPNACEGQDGCEWVGGGGVCECFIGPDGEEICDCEDRGFCQPAAPAPNNCEGLPVDVCDAEPGCWPIDCVFVCQGDEMCMQQCQQEGAEGQCVSAQDICFGAPLELCNDIEVCTISEDADQCIPSGR